MRSFIFRLMHMTCAAALGLAFPATAAAQLVPVFDWSVPERYTEDGMVGVALPVTPTTPTLRVLNPEASIEGLPPLGWPADFTACQSQGDIARFVWAVDGHKVVDSPHCAARITFPSERTYRVELILVAASGAMARTSQDVNIQDWLIIGMGDSYGSGEGVPNVPLTREGLVTFEAALAAWGEARANFQEAVARVQEAQAAVDAAQAELAAARRDLDALAGAWNAVLSAQQALADANRRKRTADQTLARATADVIVAGGRVPFECAQWWDPAGCSAARSALTRARQAEAAAISIRQQAVRDVSTAQTNLANAVLALPVEGFEYARGVVEARIDVLSSRLGVARTALDSAVQFVASADEILAAAAAALYERAGGTAALWQDSMAIPGRIVLNEAPFYEPHVYSQCHQSKFSGQARAALAIEQADSKTSVTFIHLACSGATTHELLNPYSGIEAPRPGTTVGDRRAQLNQAADLTAGREIDALVTSIGGNDVEFADLITQCITSEPCFVETHDVLTDAAIDDMCESYNQGPHPVGFVRERLCKATLQAARNRGMGSNANDVFMAALAELPGKYAQVQARIASKWPTLPANRMFLTEYPVFTRDEGGNLCGSYQDPANNLPGISGPEHLWAEQVAGHLLNETIADQERALGWTVVRGLAEAFRTHGYCSNDSWVVRLGESMNNQAWLTGVAHPNRAGYDVYAETVSAALRQQFYPGSTATVRGPARVDGRQ